MMGTMALACAEPPNSIDDANPLKTLKKLSELFGIECPASLTPPGAH